MHFHKTTSKSNNVIPNPHFFIRSAAGVLSRNTPLFLTVTPHCFWLVYLCLCSELLVWLSDHKFSKVGSIFLLGICQSTGIVESWPESKHRPIFHLSYRESVEKKKNSAQITSTSLLWNVLLHCRANTWHGTDNGSHYPLLLRFFSNTMSIAEEKSIHVAAFCSDSLSVSGKSPLFYLCPWWACRAHWEEADTQSTKCQHRSSLLCPISCTGRDICQLGAVVCWHWGISSSFQKQEI